MSGAGKGKGGGVLPVNAATTRKTLPNPAGNRSGQRAPAPRLRLIVRRLPPGLVESEFWAALGDEWQLGKGKIDTAAFKEGKVSKDPAKPSRPARAYLKVKDHFHLDALSVKVKQTMFQDAKNTTKDPCLVGPPSLEFAPYPKFSSTRVRHDGRQGTIDQDQEFIDFLQSLTEPITKPATNGEPENAQEKVTITPLVQYLKEKKANKAKEAAEKKNAKAREAREAKEAKEAKEVKATKSSTIVVKGSPAPTTTSEKARVAKATQDAVKAINKSVASMQTTKRSPIPAKAEVKPPSKEITTQASSAKRERDRGNASAAARMLQRDLGLAPRSPRVARDTPISPAAAKAEPATTEKPTIVPTQEQKLPTTPTTATPPTGPRSTRTPSADSAAPKFPPQPAAARPVKSLPQPSAGAKSAFLKHANPSQGVTEDLLRIAFEAFGTVTRCEIDKKKGLGYVNFDDTEALRKAMHASPVKVGNGQVVVLENRGPRKTPFSGPPAQSPVAKAAAPVVPDAVPDPAASPGASAASPAQSAATLAAQSTPAPPTVSFPHPQNTPTAPAATVNPPLSPAAVSTPPMAPRGAARGGARGARGGSTPRGNFGLGRGAQRGGFRGGRGNFGPRGGRAAAAPIAANASTPTGPAAQSGRGSAGGEEK